jgi:hypothetical protein
MFDPLASLIGSIQGLSETVHLDSLKKTDHKDGQGHQQ